MTWRERLSPIAVGDKVAYSKQFLQSTGQHTGPVPFARGTVKELKPLGETTLAKIEWDCPECPETVNVRNLSRVSTERGIIDRS